MVQIPRPVYNVLFELIEVSAVKEKCTLSGMPSIHSQGALCHVKAP